MSIYFIISLSHFTCLVNNRITIMPLFKMTKNTQFGFFGHGPNSFHFRPNKPETSVLDPVIREEMTFPIAISSLNCVLP